MNYTYYHGPKKTLKAKNLRRRQTREEKMLWEELRNRKLGGFKFRRQHVIMDFIVDFYCCEKRLVIEIDGLYHEDQEQKAKDAKRELELRDENYIVVRFTNSEVHSDLKKVLDGINEVLQSLPSHTKSHNYSPPSPKERSDLEERPGVRIPPSPKERSDLEERGQG